MAGQQPDSAGTSLDKLGQLPQNAEITRGEILQKLRKRARAKYLTMPVVKKLVELDSSINSYYERALECCSVMRQEDGELKATYCKSRCCIVCNRIRSGRIINEYGQIFAQWDQVQHVTLTIPNVSADQLEGALDEMRDQFTNCKRSIRRTRGLPFEAVRVTEVTYSRERGDYHPHFHVLVRGNRSVANALVAEWLKRWEEASEGAQDVKRWGNKAKDLNELAKYCTKIVKKGGEGGMVYSAEVLDVIFRALYDRRLWQPIGFKKSDYGLTDEDPEDLEDIEWQTPAVKQREKTVIWRWNQQVCDWVDQETGQLLSEYGYTWEAAPG